MKRIEYTGFSVPCFSRQRKWEILSLPVLVAKQNHNACLEVSLEIENLSVENYLRS